MCQRGLQKDLFHKRFTDILDTFYKYSQKTPVRKKLKE